jgi:hypothetical protein
VPAGRTRALVVSSSPRVVRVRRGRSSAAWSCLRRAPSPGPSMERSGAASRAQSHRTTAPEGGHAVTPSPSAGCVRAGSAPLDLGEATDLSVTQAEVGIGSGRGGGLSTGPFPRPAPPNRTCAFPRIRLSTHPSRFVMRRPSRRLGTTATESWFPGSGIGLSRATPG